MMSEGKSDEPIKGEKEKEKESTDQAEPNEETKNQPGQEEPDAPKVSEKSEDGNGEAKGKLMQTVPSVASKTTVSAQNKQLPPVEKREKKKPPTLEVDVKIEKKDLSDDVSSPVLSPAMQDMVSDFYGDNYSMANGDVQKMQSPPRKRLSSPKSPWEEAEKDYALENRLCAVQQRCEETVSRFTRDVQNLSIELARTKEELHQEREQRRNLERVRLQYEKDINGLSKELRSMTLEMREAARRQRVVEEKEVLLASLLNEIGVEEISQVRSVVRKLRERVHLLETNARNQQQQLQWSSQHENHMQEQFRSLEAELDAARKARWQADNKRMKVEEEKEQVILQLRRTQLQVDQLKSQVSHFSSQYQSVSNQADILGRAAVHCLASPGNFPVSKTLTSPLTPCSPLTPRSPPTASSVLSNKKKARTKRRAGSPTHRKLKLPLSPSSTTTLRGAVPAKSPIRRRGPISRDVKIEIHAPSRKNR